MIQELQAQRKHENSNVGLHSPWAAALQRKSQNHTVHNGQSPGFTRDAGYFSMPGKGAFEAQTATPPLCISRCRNIYLAAPSQCNLRS
jgi:hypothetical protein